MLSYTGEQHTIGFEEPVYTVGLGENREFATDRVRLAYTSMVTPASVFDYVVAARELILRKRRRSRRLRPLALREPPLMAPGQGRRRGADHGRLAQGPPARRGGPLLLYGYGAYGHGLDPAFAPSRLSLLDRGVAFAYAHVRGGDEMGWHWYREGKLAGKRNSFKDFVACAEHLIREGYAKPGEIAIRGGSAGGMLIGAVLNMRPDDRGRVRRTRLARARRRCRCRGWHRSARPPVKRIDNVYGDRNLIITVSRSSYAEQ